MPSLVWGRSPQEAFDNPYEYAAQDQFVREAYVLLKRLNDGLQKYSIKFHRDNRSARKAIWMLQLDALDSLRDALDALTAKKHRMAAKLFRDVVETLDLAAYFHCESEKSKRHLVKWFNNKCIPNSVYRNFIKQTEGEPKAKAKGEYYKSLSKYTHRTYLSLLNGYCLGQNNMIWHDRFKNSDMFVLPQTIAMYFAVLADLIIEFLSEIIERGLLSKKEVKDIVKASLETETVPRRFIPMLR